MTLNVQHNIFDFLILTSQKIENDNFLILITILGIWGIKNVGKWISSRLEDKLKSVFRILIALLDNFSVFGKTHV